MKRILLLFVVSLFVIGCGGSTEETVSPEASSEIPEPEPESCYHHDEQEIIDFLKDTGCSSPGFFEECINDDSIVVKWVSAPVLRTTEDATEYERNLIGEVVNAINLALPNEYDITIGQDIEDFPSGIYTAFSNPSEEEKIPEGEIHLGFVSDIENAFGTALRGLAEENNSIFLEKGRVLISRAIRNNPTLDCDKVIMDVIAHELMHTLGFLHVTDTWLTTSVMTSYVWGRCGDDQGFSGIIGSMDQDAIRALYSMELGDDPEEFMPLEEHCE